MSYPQPYGYPVQPAQTQVLVQPYRCSTAHVVIAWVCAVLTVAYLLPWAVAATRNRRNVAAIALINLFLGWSLVGWVVALVMACGSDQPVVVVQHTYAPAAAAPVGPAPARASGLRSSRSAPPQPWAQPADRRGRCPRARRTRLPGADEGRPARQRADAAAAPLAVGAGPSALTSSPRRGLADRCRRSPAPGCGARSGPAGRPRSPPGWRAAGPARRSAARSCCGSTPTPSGELVAGRRVAMVSGTNGKTTTTHFLAAAVRAGAGPRHRPARPQRRRRQPARRHRLRARRAPPRRPRDPRDRRAGGGRPRPARAPRGPRAAELQPRPARPQPRDQGPGPELARRARCRRGRRARGRGQRRRAAGRLGRADRPPGGLGRHRDDLDPGRLAVPAVRLAAGPRAAGRLALHRVRPRPAAGDVPGGGRHDRPAGRVRGDARAQRPRRVQRLQRRLRARRGRAPRASTPRRRWRACGRSRPRPAASAPPPSPAAGPACCWPRTRPAGPRRCRWPPRRPSCWPSTRPPPTAATCPGCGTWSTSSWPAGPSSPPDRAPPTWPSG